MIFIQNSSKALKITFSPFGIKPDDLLYMKLGFKQLQSANLTLLTISQLIQYCRPADKSGDFATVFCVQNFILEITHQLGKLIHPKF